MAPGMGAAMPSAMAMAAARPPAVFTLEPGDVMVAPAPEPEEPAEEMYTLSQVASLQTDHRVKVEALMRSIHKLQDKVKDMRRADKENRRSKHIIQLQQTIVEQEAVIRQMIRSTVSEGLGPDDEPRTMFPEKQLAEIFRGKKTLRELLVSETEMRKLKEQKTDTDEKLKFVLGKYAEAKGTRDEITTHYELQIREWKAKAQIATDELQVKRCRSVAFWPSATAFHCGSAALQAMSILRADASGSKARAEELEYAMEEQTRVSSLAYISCTLAAALCPTRSCREERAPGT